MDGGDDGAHAALVGGDGGIDDALGEDAFLEEAAAQLHSQRAFTDDNGGDGRLALACAEAKLFEAALEETGVFPELVYQAGILFQQLDGRTGRARSIR